jgi:hypothetical protein
MCLIIQELYGEKGSPSGENRTSTDAPPDEEGEDSELCNDATVDTMFNSAEGVTYVFKGDNFQHI